MILNKKLIIGIIREKPKTTKRITRIIPYFSNSKILYCQAKGRKGNITFEPSKGGIGIKLKTPSNKFI
jgi:hypothetical protein